MFHIFFGWAICVQASVLGSQSQNPTNRKLVTGDHLETGNSELMEKMEDLEELEVVELDEPLKPVLHGTIVRITSVDKLCNLRMSPNKYPVK